MKFHILALCFLLCEIINTHHLFAQRAWRKIGDLQEVRFLFGALPISTQQILVMGGYTDRITSQCELIDIEERLITAAPPMNVARAESVFLLTRDSNIVAISGLTSMDGGVTPLCELYDRTRRTWTVIGRLLAGRRQHAACFLNDEEILITGGRDENIVTLRTAEIFNIRTGQSRSIADYRVPINFGYASISSQNKPIVLGGRTGGANSPRSPVVYEYNASQNSWASVSSIQEGVAAPGFVRLYDKRVMIAGGTRNEDPSNFSNLAFLEAYPNFQVMSPLSVERHWCTMAQWNADTVMVLGGFDNNDQTMPTTEWISLTSSRTSPAPTMTAGHSQFVTLGMPLFNAQGLQTKARIVAISGRSNNAFATPTVEMLEADVPLPPPPFPTIANTFTETNDCTTFRLTLRTTTGTIRNIELGTSANVALQVLTPLPAPAVELVVRLANPFAPAMLSSLRITDSLARMQFVSVSAAFPQRRSTTLRVLSPPLERLFGDSATTLTCATLLIRNDARADALFPLAYFQRNIQFSAPLSQFPLRIPASSEAALRVCYAPSVQGFQRDTITFFQDCSILQIPLVAWGSAPVFEGITRCAAPVRLRGMLPSSGEQAVIVADAPFPQPASDAVLLSFQAVSISPIMDKPRITLYNSLGIQQGIFTADEWQEAGRENETYRYTGLVSLRVNTLPTGLYRANILSTNGAFASVAILVVR
jgi:hypothetical protein